MQCLCRAISALLPLHPSARTGTYGRSAALASATSSHAVASSGRLLAARSAAAMAASCSDTTDAFVESSCTADVVDGWLWTSENDDDNEPVEIALMGESSPVVDDSTRAPDDRRRRRRWREVSSSACGNIGFPFAFSIIHRVTSASAGERHSAIRRAAYKS